MNWETNTSALEAALAPLASGERRYSARSIIWHTGDQISDLLLVRSGWAFRYNLLFDGRRQIFSIFTTGDIVSPQLLNSPVVRYSLQTVTEMEALTIPISAMNNAMSRDARISDMVTRLHHQQHVYYDERLIELGRLNALEKVCAFLMRLLRKMENLDLHPENTYEIPITREIISDTLGLTPVHVSRTMKQLESEGVVTWVRRSLRVRDMDRLKSFLPKFYPTSGDIYLDTTPQV